MSGQQGMELGIDIFKMVILLFVFIIGAALLVPGVVYFSSNISQDWFEGIMPLSHCAAIVIVRNMAKIMFETESRQVSSKMKCRPVWMSVTLAVKISSMPTGPAVLLTNGSHWETSLLQFSLSWLSTIPPPSHYRAGSTVSTRSW